MKKLFVSTAVALSISASAFVPTVVLAHGDAEGVVKERMEAMESMGDAVKSLKDMMQGKVDYDADVVRKQAAVIKSHAGDELTENFPKGSNHKPSEAKAEIWNNWDHFSQLAAQLEVFAEGLAQAADNGLMMSSDKANSGMGAMMGGKNPMMNGQGMGSMMGKGMGMKGAMMEGDHLSAENLAQMPADGVFTMMVQTCSACHSDYRAKK